MLINQLVFSIFKTAKRSLVYQYIKERKESWLFFLDNYEWKYENHTELPPDDELIIYELHVSDFCGTFQDIISKIDHLKKLGINASKILPSFTFRTFCKS